MNTEQTYTGKGVPANHPLALHYAKLHEHIDEFTQETAASSDIERLGELFYGYLADEVGYYEDAEDRKTKRYELRAHHLEAMYAVQRLMVNVTKIKERWVSIEMLKQRPVAPGTRPVATPPSNAPVSSVSPRIEPWRVSFLTGVLADDTKTETLFQLLYHLLSMHDSTDPTAAITKLLGDFTKNPATDLNSEENRRLIQAVTGHLADMNEFHANFFCFDTMTGYINTVSTNEEKA